MTPKFKVGDEVFVTCPHFNSCVGNPFAEVRSIDNSIAWVENEECLKKYQYDRDYTGFSIDIEDMRKAYKLDKALK